MPDVVTLKQTLFWKFMNTNYDPDGVPTLSPALAAHALESNCHVVHFICDEPNAKEGDAGGVSFFTSTPFIPRRGEKIKLEDGRYCVVQNTGFVVARHGEITTLVPNVYAILDI